MYRQIAINASSALLALALSTFLFTQYFFSDPESDPDADAASTSPEWYWHNARLRSYDEQGRLSQEASASSVEFFRERDTAELVQPRLTVYAEADATPWRARADRGEFSEDYEIGELWGDVNISRGDDEVEVTTNRLLLNRRNNTARTEDPVAIHSDAGRTTAVGMRAWLDQEKIELLADVRTQYAPQ